MYHFGFQFRIRMPLISWFLVNESYFIHFFSKMRFRRHESLNFVLHVEIVPCKNLWKLLLLRVSCAQLLVWKFICFFSWIGVMNKYRFYLWNNLHLSPPLFRMNLVIFFPMFLLHEEKKTFLLHSTKFHAKKTKTGIEEK